MNAVEILNFVRPEHLVFFEHTIETARGDVIVKGGHLGAIRLLHVDALGADIEVYASPITMLGEPPSGIVGLKDLAGKIRPATADEERAWIKQAEEAEKPRLTEAEAERRADRIVQRRMFTDPRYMYAENAEEQQAAEDAIEREVWAQLTARYEVL